MSGISLSVRCVFCRYFCGSVRSGSKFLRTLLSAEERDDDDEGEEGEEEEGEGHPAEEAAVEADFRFEHVPVALEVHGDDDEGQDPGHVELRHAIGRHLEAFAGIDFGDEVLEAPAVLAGAEEDEGQRAEGQQVVRDDEVFEVEDGRAFPEELDLR